MADSGRDYILAGDIGGTKTFLGLFDRKGDALEPVKEGAFVNSSYRDHEDILNAFLDRGEASKIESASFGIAGPVVGNRCALTNLLWDIDGEALRKRLGIPRLELINDLVAIGWGVGLLSEEDLVALQKGEPARGNAALIAAGTGLGECVLYWDGSAHVPSASEGGHADFAPRNRMEFELLEHLARTYGHVSYERVLSGPGLENIYDFLLSKSGGADRLRAKTGGGERAPVIAHEATYGGDKTARDALEMFVSIYGAEAGNLALKAMAVGGVYVGGGIAPKILKALEDGPFIESFSKKGRFEKLLSNIPVYAILYDKTGLLGAAHYAYTIIPGNEGRRLKRVITAEGKGY